MLRTLFLSLICVVASAAPPLTITDSGYYLTVVDAKGVPTLQKIDTIVDLRKGGQVPDTPIPDTPIADTPVAPEPPAVVVDKALVAVVKEASLAIQDTDSAQAIALVYTQVRDAFGDGLVDSTSLWTVIKTATDSALVVTVVGGTDWKPFRSKLSALITERRQQGLLDSKEEILAYLTAVKAGLEQSAEGSAALAFDKTIKVVQVTNEAIDAN